jgi:hypothetical protein
VTIPTAGSQFFPGCHRLAVQAFIVYGGDVVMAKAAIDRRHVFLVRKILDPGQIHVAIDAFQRRVDRLMKFVGIDRQRDFLAVPFGRQARVLVTHQAFVGGLSPQRLDACGR